MTRDEILDALWAKAEPAIFLTKEEFICGLAEWEHVVHYSDGEPAFVAVVNGPEFHFQSLDTKKPLSRLAIKQFLARIVGEHGYAQTRTPKLPEFERQHRFNRAFGFRPVGEDVYDVIYRFDGKVN